MRWHKRAQNNSTYEEMAARIKPWVNKGILSPMEAEGDLWQVNAIGEDGGHPFELWIEEDPMGGHALALGYRGQSGQIEDSYFDYDVKSLLGVVQEWGGTLEGQAKPAAARSIKEVQEELYDAYKAQDDARLRPLLDEYEKMTGKKRPGFMAARKGVFRNS